MVIIQNKELDIIAVQPTLTKALDEAGIDRKKYEYIRSKLSKEPLITWKGFTIRRWKT